MKYIRNYRHKKKDKIIAFIVNLLIVLILSASTYVTVAWIQNDSNPVTNAFSPAMVSCKVNEDESIYDSNENLVEKRNVTITNTSNINAYIRVTLVPSWNDKDGNIAATTPVKGVDYNIDINNTDWFEKDGYYYCKAYIEPGQDTPVLINSCNVINTNGDLHLELQVIASAIQYLPVGAVESAWSVNVGTNGNLEV